MMPAWLAVIDVVATPALLARTTLFTPAPLKRTFAPATALPPAVSVTVTVDFLPAAIDFCSIEMMAQIAGFTTGCGFGFGFGLTVGGVNTGGVNTGGVSTGGVTTGGTAVGGVVGGVTGGSLGFSLHVTVVSADDVLSATSVLSR